MRPRAEFTKFTPRVACPAATPSGLSAWPSSSLPLRFALGFPNNARPRRSRAHSKATHMAQVPVSLPASAASADHPVENQRFALSVLTSLFFMWGFLTCLNDILIPHFKAMFSLSYAKAMLVQTVFFAAFFVVSIPAGRLVSRVGYHKGIVIGLVVAALGCFGFYPAASARSYEMFLTALFVLAAGITVLQVSANPFVAVLGSAATASSRLSMAQAFNSLATTLAPEFGKIFILAVASKSAVELLAMSSADADAHRFAEARSVQLPYVGLAITLVVLAVAMALVKLPKLQGHQEQPGVQSGSLMAHKHLIWGAVGIFAYVGAEVSIGSFLINYFKEPTIAGLSESNGAGFVKYYWGGLMVGRFIGTFTLRLWKPSRVLAFHVAAVVALLAVTMSTSGSVAMWSVLAIGLFNSIMFPTIFTLALEGLGPLTSKGSGLLCMAIVGGAVVPLLQGLLADRVGVHPSFVVPLACYAYLIWFALRGSRRTVVSSQNV